MTPSPAAQFVRAALVVVVVLAAGLLLELTAVSSLLQRAAQQRAFDAFRGDLARGTAPVGPTGVDGRELAPGTPVAFIEIPSIELRQVVVEGTDPSSLFDGPGHRRDTPLPGQRGVSVLMGRRAAFGAPFARLKELRRGEVIRVTTGQGVAAYRVSGLRRAGDPAPPPLGSEEGRLVLATADGRPFLPTGVLRVDADLTQDAAATPPLVRTAGTLPSREQLMSTDASSLWALALWLQALNASAAAAVWAWVRWGKAQSWVVFLPAILVIGIFAGNEAARLLPNLL